ncbi:MAG: GAF domain-containing SpoIIE family protein phosphatase [Planctomycetota bacterium]
MLLDTIAEVSSTLDLDEVLVRVVDRSLDLTGAERGILFLPDTDGEAVPRVVRERGRSHLSLPVQYSRCVTSRVLALGRPEFIEVQAQGQQGYDPSQSFVDLKLRTLMCAPLTSNGRPIGALYVDSRTTGDREFGEDDLRFFTALADSVAIAIENARLHEKALETERLKERLSIAAEIQRDALPPNRLELPGYDIYGVSRPCEETGGDYFDYLVDERPRVGLVVGDVTGHGLGAALYMLNARARLRSSLTWEPDASRVLEHLDRELEREMPSGKFMTLLVTTLDTEDRTVRSISAGHEAPLLLRAGADDFEQLPGRGAGLAMGIGSGWRVSEPCRLEPGDLLVLATDGIPEAHVPVPEGEVKDLWGEKRFRDRLRELRDEDSESIVRGVLAAINEHVGGREPEDDITLIVVKVEA